MLGAAGHDGNVPAGHAAMTLEVMLGPRAPRPLVRISGPSGRSTCNASPSPIDHPVDRAHAYASDFLRIGIDAVEVNELQAQIGSPVRRNARRARWRC